MTPILRRAAARERTHGTHFLEDPLDYWVGQLPDDIQREYAECRRQNHPTWFEQRRPLFQCQLDGCANTATGFCSADNCKVILCAKVVDGKRHDRCAEHSEEVADKGYAGLPPSTDKDDSDDPSNPGGSNNSNSAKRNRQATDQTSTGSGNQGGSNNKPTTKRAKTCDLAQAQFLDVAAEALQEEVNGEAATVPCNTVQWVLNYSKNRGVL